MHHMHPKSGFSLIEILITLTILSILLTVSIPIYSHYLVYEKRLEAEAALGKLAVQMERYYIEHNTYENATLAKLQTPEQIANASYQLSIHIATEVDYVLVASPLDDQADKDDMCGTLTLNALGKKTISGSGKVSECW